jgi:hypothetical protein
MTSMILGLAVILAVTIPPLLTAVGEGGRGVRANVAGHECTISARTPQELAALLADTTIATPPATTGGQTLPAGVPVSPEDRAVMERVIHQWLACENAGEPLRAWALFSDGYLHRLLARQGLLSDEAFASLATPSPSGSDPARLHSIEGERELPDGRLGATVTISYPAVPTPKTFFFFFTRGDDRLLIDGILGEISFSVP